jgi:hypothetical protein
MTAWEELLKRDSVTGAWFWVDSIDVGPYAEEEKFDAMFTRETGLDVGIGEIQRRTLYVMNIVTHRSKSRRENSGRAVRPDLVPVLAQLVNDAHIAGMYDTFRAWAEDQRDMGLGYRDALNDFEVWETLRERHAQLTTWLGPMPSWGPDSGVYDAYAEAAAAYVAEH